MLCRAVAWGATGGADTPCGDSRTNDGGGRRRATDTNDGGAFESGNNRGTRAHTHANAHRMSAVVGGRHML